jgi:hypothetical protein
MMPDPLRRRWYDMVRQHSIYSRKRKNSMSGMMLFFWTLVIIGGLIGIFSLIKYVPSGGTNFIGA